MEFLKFAVKNNEDPQFKDYSLVRNYIELLEDLEKDINKIFSEPVTYKDDMLEYPILLKTIFKEDLPEYKDFIDNSDKKKLVEKFHLLMNLVDIVHERSFPEPDGYAAKIIDKEIKKYKTLLEPLLNINILIKKSR